MSTSDPKRRIRTRTSGPLGVELEFASRRRSRKLRPPRSRGSRSRPPWERRRAIAIPWRVPAVLIVLAAGAYVVVFGLVRGLPDAAVAPVPRASAFPGRMPALAWPRQGQAAIGVEGVGLLGSHGASTPTPIASVAKVMTAYVVLRDHPLAGDRGGPTITVTPADVAAFRSDLAGAQSVVAVRAGEKLTERQALEGLLLPSGNNIATLLARWDAGSSAAFVAKMNAVARRLGLDHTRYVDAAGYQPGTVSIASDQVRLAMLALQIPAFRQIVRSPQATLPVAGRQFNVNALVGRNGIVGVKTGSTTQAGGCFVFAADERVGGQTALVVGAVLHQPPTPSQPSVIDGTLQTGTTLLASMHRALRRYVVVRRGATLATVKEPWGSEIPAQAAETSALVGWPGLRIQTVVSQTRKLAAPLAADERIGTAVVSAGQQRLAIPLALAAALPGASFGWRLKHP